MAKKKSLVGWGSKNIKHSFSWNTLLLEGIYPLSKGKLLDKTEFRKIRITIEEIKESSK